MDLWLIQMLHRGAWEGNVLFRKTCALCVLICCLHGITAQAETVSLKSAAEDLLQGRNQAVIEACTRAIEVEPEKAEAYSLRAIALARMRRQSACERDCAKVIELDSAAINRDPKDVAAHIRRGRAYLLQDDDERASSDAAHALELAPSSGDARRLHARVLSARRDYEGAVAELNVVLNTDNADAEAHAVRAKARYGMGAFDDALADLAKAIHLCPEQALYYEERGDYYYALKSYSRALPELTKALEFAPDDFELYYKRTLTRYQQGDEEGAEGDLARVLELAGRTVSEHPDELLPRLRLAFIAFMQGTGDPAADHDEIVRLHPTSSKAYAQRAYTKEKAYEPDSARADYTKAIELDPENSAAYARRAELAASWKDAISDWNRVCELKPNHSGSFEKRAVVHANAGDYPEAAEDYTTALRLLSPLHDEYVDARVALLIARSEVRMLAGDPEGGLSDCEEAIALAPQDRRGYDKRATLRLLVGDTKGSEADRAMSRRLATAEIRRDWTWKRFGGFAAFILRESPVFFLLLLCVMVLHYPVTLLIVFITVREAWHVARWRKKRVETGQDSGSVTFANTLTDLIRVSLFGFFRSPYSMLLVIVPSLLITVRAEKQLALLFAGLYPWEYRLLAFVNSASLFTTLFGICDLFGIVNRRRFLSTHTLSYGEKGVLLETPDGASNHYSWPEVKRVEAGRSFLHLSLGKKVKVAIPKRVLGDAARFEEVYGSLLALRRDTAEAGMSQEFRT